MDLNQNPLSKYQTQSSRSYHSSSTAGNISASRPLPAGSTISNREISPDSLAYKEGTVIRGEVIDLRYQEVKIKLEPGDQILTARLSGDLPLSIGQTAEFVISDISSEHFTLKYIPIEMSFQQMTVINALEASSLPQTERNKALVSELLNHKLPIDKQTLSLLIRFAGNAKDIPPQTIVSMFKNNIPLTLPNAIQFEHYRQNPHPLPTDLRDLSVEFTDFISVNLSPEDTSLTGNTLNNLSDSLKNLPPKASFTPEGLLASESLAKEFVIREFLVNLFQIKGSESLLNHAAGNISPDEPGISSPAQEGLLLNNELSSIPEAQEDGKTPVNGILRQPDTSKIIEQSDDSPSSLPNTPVSAVSSSSEQAALPPELLSSLRSDPTLLRDALTAKWALTPDELNQQDSITKYFHSLKDDLKKLDHLTELGKSLKSMNSFEDAVQKVQDNIDFMKTLNQLFSYVQIPLHLPEDKAHGDLYILNRKKNSGEKQDNLSVLIHLDMPHLGEINIHIAMEINRLQATFRIESEPIAALLREHLPKLSEALSQKGYHLQSRVETEIKEMDFIRDILGDQLPEDSSGRYSFDIRA